MRNKLEIDFCGIKCENPFFLSSSVVGSKYEMIARAFELGWAGVVYKTITCQETLKEVSPRFSVMKRTNNNIIGFKNLEIKAEPTTYLQDFETMKRLKKDFPNKVIISSIMGRSDEEWEELSRLTEESGVDMLELNFSCPHTVRSTMGSAVGEDPELCRYVCSIARSQTKMPIIAKMTANATHMAIPAAACIEGGADAISAINTIKSITGVDLDEFVVEPNVRGKSAPSGYSGTGVKPIALRFIQEMAEYPKLKGIPLSGVGGIESWRDAAEFIVMGASMVQITTAIMLYGYRIIDDLIDGLEGYLEEKGIEKVEDLVGKGLGNILPPNDLERGFINYPIFNEETCVGCGRCYLSCLDGGHQAIEWEKGKRKPRIMEDKCVSCHLCALVCPVGAIESRKEAR